MKPLKPKLLAPAASKATGGGQAERWAASCLDYLRTECHLAANTIAAYRRDLNRFCEWLGGRLAAKQGVRELSDYMGWLQTKKLAPASVARHIVALKIFYRYLQLEGVVRDNPAELLGTQKRWQYVPEVLSPTLVEQLLAAPQRYDAFWRRDRALLELLYATGCRVSEVSDLKLVDLHLGERYCLAHGKGSKDRLTPLGDAAIQAIGDYLSEERPQSGAGGEVAAAVGAALARRQAAAAGSDLGAGEALFPASRHERRRQPAHAAAQLCHAPIGRRRRPAAGARAARPRQHRHDADLHARRSITAQTSP